MNDKIARECMKLLLPNGLAEAYKFVLKMDEKSKITPSGNRIKFNRKSTHNFDLK